MKKKPGKSQILIEQMPGETEAQFSAFLAYCYMLKRSIREVSKRWAEMGRELEEQNSRIRLGKRPALKTLFQWSSNFHWVQRSKLWDEEKKELMTLEFQRSEKQRAIKVSRLYEKLGTYLLSQVNRSRPITVDEFKKAWEMFRTESGLSTGKTEVSHSINEDEQKPPTPEEKALGQEIDKAIKKFYDRQRSTTKK